MITYFVTKRHGYTIGNYLKGWGRALAGRFRVVSYESLFRGLNKFEARPGTYIFSDIERLEPMMAELAVQAWRKISDLGDEARILNHPTRSMRRYELLRALFERGDNAFNVYRMVESRQPRRWPVFIRQEHEHTKNLTELLHTPEELDAAVAEIFEKGYSREVKLIVEFCDTKDDDGLYDKYSAFMIGERIIPRSLGSTRHWVAHAANSVRTPRLRERERLYLETNPHEHELREIFRLARIEYGKIDYGVLGDRLQVWEINTNPNLLPRSDNKILSSEDPADAERKAMLHRLHEPFAAAYAEIDMADVHDEA